MWCTMHPVPGITAEDNNELEEFFDNMDFNEVEEDLELTLGFQRRELREEGEEDDEDSEDDSEEEPFMQADE